MMINIQFAWKQPAPLPYSESGIKQQLSNVTWEFGIRNLYYNKVTKNLPLYVIEIYGWDLKTTFKAIKLLSFLNSVFSIAKINQLINWWNPFQWGSDEANSQQKYNNIKKGLQNYKWLT